MNVQDLKTHALALGFNMIGITRAVPSPTLDAYERWVEAGMYGTMGYLARPDRLLRRRDLTAILPNAQTLIMVGVDYSTFMPKAVLQDPTRGRIAMYAWQVDYHDVMAQKLDQLAEWLTQTHGASKVYVDTGAILERSHASQAGMGFTGKNTMLIHPRRGSYFFLGEIITDLEMDEYDSPRFAPTMCGSCTRCLNACPTDAFPQPHVLDARRCISYLTIEHKASINLHLRPLMGNWIFGCDVCQEVCPFQRFAQTAMIPEFQIVDVERAAPQLETALQHTDESFSALYHGTPVMRVKRERFIRNACIASGNSGEPKLIPYLEKLLIDPSPLIQEHARWALEQLSL